MTIELPVLRIGFAGFSSEQQDELAQLVALVATGSVHWEVSELEQADAWLVNGAKVQETGDKLIRIGAGAPTARSLQLNLAEMDRPLAFTRPCRLSVPTFSFDFGSAAGLALVLRRFEAWQSHIVGQFCLAAHIVEHQTALRSGVFSLTRGSLVIAMVSMHGETAVLATAAPADFEDAVWRREDPEMPVPENFVRATMSHLMWLYATRTQRDVLPRHYRNGAIYFRRAPRVPQRMLKDSHLLLLRELAAGPATLEALERRCEILDVELAHDLAALYFVGAITSNPKRAAQVSNRVTFDCETMQGPQSNLPSGLDSVPPDLGRRSGTDLDNTAPAPIGPP